VQVGGEPALHLGDIVEAVRVEQLLLEVPVEILQLAVPLLVFRRELPHLQLLQQAAEARDSLPAPKRRALVVEYHLGLAVAGDGLLEGVDHQVGALGVIDPVPDHKAAVVVQQDQRECGGPADPAVDEVEVPAVVGADGLEALVVVLATDLRRPVAGVLHHPTSRGDRDLDSLAA
jgi:hypothetical protein